MLKLNQIFIICSAVLICFSLFYYQSSIGHETTLDNFGIENGHLSENQKMIDESKMKQEQETPLKAINYQVSQNSSQMINVMASVTLIPKTTSVLEENFPTNLSKPPTSKPPVSKPPISEPAASYSIDKKEIKKYLESKVFKGNLIVAVANAAHKDFVMNWRESMIRNLKNTDKFVVICLDTDLHLYLTQNNVPNLPLPSLIQTDIASQFYENAGLEAEKKWATSDYYILVNIKVEVVKEILREYDMKVIFTDVDLVWMNENMVDYMNHVMESGKYDFLYSLDNWFAQDTIVCTGFYAVRPSPYAISFLESVVQDERRNQTHDQDIVQSHIREIAGDDEKRRKFGYLPLILFQNGQVVDMKISEIFKVEPWLIHANYRIGANDKKMLLQSQKVWYLNPQ